MPDPYGPSTIVLKTGEAFEIEFDFTAGDWFEEKSGHALLPAFTQHFGPRTLCYLLLAGCRKTRPKLSYEQLREKLNAHLRAGGTMPELSRAIQKALVKNGILRGTDEGAGEEEGERPTPAEPKLVNP